MKDPLANDLAITNYDDEHYLGKQDYENKLGRAMNIGRRMWR